MAAQIIVGIVFIGVLALLGTIKPGRSLFD